jgi:hypothetical protein
MQDCSVHAEPVTFMCDTSAIGITTGCWLECRGAIPSKDKILYSTASGLALGPTQPPIQLVPGVLSPGVKRAGREADHSPYSTEVKSGGAILPLPHTPSWRGA